MINFIMTAREHHRVRTAAEMLKKHALKMRQKQNAGARFEVHEDPAQLTAFINGGSWVVICSCGGGNSTEPSWGLAVCFGCGAVHRNITFPSPGLMAAGEAVLLRRPVQNRNWEPGAGESVEVLVAENIEHGVVEVG